MVDRTAYKDRTWRRQPAAMQTYRAILNDMLSCCPQALQYATHLHDETGVRLRDIVDYIEFSNPDIITQLEGAGWRREEGSVWKNPEGLFPAFVQSEKATIWIKAECVDRFLYANLLTGSIEGAPYGPIRRVVVFTTPDSRLGVVERNGYAGFDAPESRASEIRCARMHYQKFASRRREFDSPEAGLSHTEKIVNAAVADIGPHRACDLWLKAEREYWMRRCSAGQLQKQRQDALGVGWANIDHHTYDGSRRHFQHTIGILEKLGYQLREMLYAGELAGWGSQVLEQPVIGSTIFADVDLSPEELTVDFAHEELPELPKHRRAGLLSALLGESILEAGLNHVAGLYDQKSLRAQLRHEGVQMMKPFTDWPHLYQELTTGDWTAVDPARVDALEVGGHLSAEEAEKLRLEGSILSHLENIERNDGYKGFNREGIDGVLRKLDPRAYLSAESSQPAQ